MYSHFFLICSTPLSPCALATLAVSHFYRPHKLAASLQAYKSILVGLRIRGDLHFFPFLDEESRRGDFYSPFEICFRFSGVFDAKRLYEIIFKHRARTIKSAISGSILSFYHYHARKKAKMLRSIRRIFMTYLR